MAMSIPRLKRLKRKTNPYEQRVFISNAGVSTTELTYYVAAHTGGANGLCNEFYAARSGPWTTNPGCQDAFRALEVCRDGAGRFGTAGYEAQSLGKALAKLADDV